MEFGYDAVQPVWDNFLRGKEYTVDVDQANALDVSAVCHLLTTFLSNIDAQELIETFEQRLKWCDRDEDDEAKMLRALDNVLRMLGLLRMTMSVLLRDQYQRSDDDEAA